ncbi:hypothetical protein ACE6H2_002956 [Prunus campanulata]
MKLCQFSIFIGISRYILGLDHKFITHVVFLSGNVCDIILHLFFFVHEFSGFVKEIWKS